MNKTKALVVTTVASTIDQFCMNDIDTILKLYDELHVVANFREGNNTSKERIKKFKEELKEKNIIIHDFNFSRSPLNKMNFIEYKKIKKLIESENYNLIHCHTPIASFITRLAARKSRKNGTIVIYSAHGFHFFKGAPILNWIIYYPIEKLCSYFTDILVTINEEDYNLARKKMKSKRIYKIPGIGVDTERFSNIEVNREEKRKILGIPKDSIMLLSVAELNKNKNQEVIIRALSKLNKSDIHYCIVGKGNYDEYLNKLIDSLNLRERVHLLGYRSDIGELCKVADIFCFPSYREGLGIAAIEAMSAGLPLITSNVHGINDYSQNGVTGFSCKPSSIEEFSTAIFNLSKDIELRNKMGKNNVEVAKQFDIKISKEKMMKIYKGALTIR